MRKILVFMFAFIFLASFVLADTTTLNVKTFSYAKVHLVVLAVNSVYDVIDTFHTQADWEGNANITYSVSPEYVDLKFQVDGEDGTTLLIERMEDMKTGGVLYVQLIPGDVKKDATPAPVILNVTANETANITANSTINTNQTARLTGNAVSSVKDFVAGKSKYFIWILVVAVVIAGVVLFIIKRPFKISLPASNPEPKIIRSETSENKETTNKLLEAEKKLQEAQREIARMKNQERIREIEKRIAAEQAEIDKLNNGFGPQ